MAGVHDWGGDLHNRRVDCCIFRLNFQGELIYKSVNSKDRRWCYVCSVHTDKRILVRECYCLWGWCAYYVIRMPYACVHPLWWLLWWYSVVCATMIVDLTACKMAGKNMSKAMGTASAWELNRVRWVYRTAGDRAGCLLQIFLVHYDDCYDIMLATCDIDYGHDCMQDGRNE